MSLIDQGREARRVREDLEQRRAVHGAGDARGTKEGREGALGDLADPQMAILKSALGLGPHLVAEIARGVLDQYVLLAREVAEEGRPAHTRLGDDVLDPSRVDSIRLIEGDGGVVEAISLLGASGLSGGRGSRAPGLSPAA